MPQLVMGVDGGEARPVVVHMSCFIETMAGTTAEIVLQAIKTKMQPIKLKARGHSLREKLVDLALAHLAGEED